MSTSPRRENWIIRHNAWRVPACEQGEMSKVIRNDADKARINRICYDDNGNIIEVLTKVVRECYLKVVSEDNMWRFNYHKLKLFLKRNNIAGPRHSNNDTFIRMKFMYYSNARSDVEVGNSIGDQAWHDCMDDDRWMEAHAAAEDAALQQHPKYDASVSKISDQTEKIGDLRDYAFDEGESFWTDDN